MSSIQAAVTVGILQAGTIYTFDLVLKHKSIEPQNRVFCSLALPPPCHVVVFQGSERTKPPHREVKWDKTTCPRGPEEDQQQDYSEQGDYYCIYLAHNNTD